MSSAAEAASSISSLMKSENAWLSTRRMRVGGHCSGLTWGQRLTLIALKVDPLADSPALHEKFKL